MACIKLLPACPRKLRKRFGKLISKENFQREMTRFAQQNVLSTARLWKIQSHGQNHTPRKLRKQTSHRMLLSCWPKTFFKNVTESNCNGFRTWSEVPNFHAFPLCKEFCCMKNVIRWHFSCNKILCTKEKHESLEPQITS